MFTIRYVVVVVRIGIRGMRWRRIFPGVKRSRLRKIKEYLRYYMF